MSDSHDRFVLLATVGDVGTARVFAARLDAEGIEVRLHGEGMGPYPVTVGQMAATQLWVAAGRLEEASRIMLEAEVDSLGDGTEASPSATGGLPSGRQLTALAALIVIVAIVVRLL